MSRTRAALLFAAVLLAQLSIAVLFLDAARALSHPLLAGALMLCVLADILRREN